jgi:hypothetical protein
LELTLLTEGIFGVLTHYVWDERLQMGKTVPCTLYEGECAVHRKKREWCGWMPVWDHHQKGKAVLRLAPLEADALELCLGKEGAWQHQVVLITPHCSNKGKFVSVERRMDRVTPMKIQPFAIGPTICAVLGCRRVPQQGPRAAELREEGGQEP